MTPQEARTFKGLKELGQAQARSGGWNINLYKIGDVLLWDDRVQILIPRADFDRLIAWYTTGVMPEESE